MILSLQPCTSSDLRKWQVSSFSLPAAYCRRDSKLTIYLADRSPSFTLLIFTLKTSPSIKKTLNGYVGFHTLPNQVHRKSIKKGFNFTLMIVGESGLGKSTLMNTLFNTCIYPGKTAVELSAETTKTVDLQSVSADIEENGVALKLNIIDTPGFGDFINNEESWKPILENIEHRFDAYLDQESRVNRKKIIDTRVHACIYFIQPTGHSLKPLDVEFMKRLSAYVNIIPVIAKADTLTEDEVVAFKKRIMDDIAYNKIDIFMPPSYLNDDPETVKENRDITDCIPFAVVGSDQDIEVGGKKVRGRKYPWGVIEIENEAHCDFVKLRQMLIRTHMEELRDRTSDVLYENFRTNKLNNSSTVDNSNPLNKLDDEKKQHEQKMIKMEAEMKLVFQQKVAEKEAKLKASEEELYARHREMKEQLERQRVELEEKRRKLEGRSLSMSEKPKKGKGLFNK